MYYEVKTHVGVFHKDNLHLEVKETLRKAALVFRRQGNMVEREVAFVKVEGVYLLVGDIPPLALEMPGARRSPIVLFAISPGTGSAPLRR